MKRNAYRLALLVFVIITSFVQVHSQIHDNSFSGDGQLGIFNGFHSNSNAVSMQSTGKIIVGGSYRDESGFLSMAAMRVNTNGTVDQTFGVLGLKFISFEKPSIVYATAVQPDDKIILAGLQWVHSGFTGFDSIYIEVIRLNADGSKDLGFGTDGVCTFDFGTGDHTDDNGAATISLQPDGKIIIGGWGGAFGTFHNPAPLVMRLNTNGSLDNSFNGNGRVFLTSFGSRRVLATALQTDGKILALVCGVGTASDVRILRLNGNGSIDAGFGVSGVKTFDILTYNAGREVKIQPDGKILIVGNTYALSTASESSLVFWTVTRLNTDGSFDNSFGNSGQRAFDMGDDYNNSAGSPQQVIANDVRVASNGKIIITGASYDKTLRKHDMAVIRLNPNGTNDQNFGDGGKYFLGLTNDYYDAYFAGAYLQPDGKLLIADERYVGSYASFSDLYITRLILLRPPKVTCPSNITVDHDANACTASVSFSATATGDPAPTVVYKIGATTITSPYNFPVGVTTVNVTASNGLTPDATCSFTVTVRDNDPPTITNESPSVSVLSPADHTMRNVTINYTVIDNCPLTATLTVSSNEPINGVADGDTDPDWVVIDDHHVQLRAERSAVGTGRIYTITITATDGSGNSAVKTVEVRVPHNMVNPHSGHTFRVGSTVNFEGEFWDRPGTKHTAKWLIDGNTSVKGTVTEPSNNKNGKVTGSYKFNSPGVYKMQMNTTDQFGVTNYTVTNGDIEEIVVVYDPNGGYTFGGGWFTSQPGALASDPSAEGKASYGFTVNYFKTSTYPKGEAQFEFKVGSLEFNALNFDYLVISGAKAQFRGTGKITGDQSGYGFIMTVIDGEIDGSGVDKIRMKIYNKSNGRVVYDNLPGASDAADPVEPVETNSEVVIYSTTNAKMITETNKSENGFQFEVKALPNPTSNSFTILLNSNSSEQIQLQVTDISGRIVETKSVSANSQIKIGANYAQGSYFVTVRQGNENKILKLIKL